MPKPPCLDRPPWEQVLFIADWFDEAASTLPPELRSDMEMSEAGTIAAVLAAIEMLGLPAHHIESPRDLAEHLRTAKQPVVFSTYGGEASRNRLLLVPAIAETFGADFVGPDAVGHALAADKMAAKQLAAECGFKTPLARLVRGPEALDLCAEFPRPYVVKPLAEGSSIGIGPQSLVRDPEVGRDQARALLERFRQPVLLEAFVPGREASICCIEGKDGLDMAFVEVAVEGRPDYFDEHLFVADEKLHRRQQRSVELVREPLAADDRLALERLLRAVGHFGYCRVDGKWHDGRLHFLELTPDAWLGPDGQLAGGFGRLGWRYEQVIAAILWSASLRPRARPASD